MARLHEYQGKAILAANGFKIPRGRAASTPDEAIAIAKEFAAEKKVVEVVIKIKPGPPGALGLAAWPSPKNRQMFAATRRACWR